MINFDLILIVENGYDLSYFKIIEKKYRAVDLFEVSTIVAKEYKLNKKYQK